ncbi:MAG: hypothetical protein ACRDJE_02205, partial [Dehalococcoidia bacterium]
MPEGLHECSNAVRRWRRPLALSLAIIAALTISVARSPAQAAPADLPAQPKGPQSEQAAAIVALAREAMATYGLRAVIVRVTIDGEEVVTAALGESMTGVPATAD